MRRRLVLSTLLVVTVVLVMLTVPVTVVLRRAATSELRVRTSQEAETVAALLTYEASLGDDIDLSVADRVVRPDDGVRVISSDGEVIAERSISATMSTMTSSAEGPDGSRVEVIASRDSVDRRLRNQLFKIAGIAAIAAIVAVVLALFQARRMARPLEQLARSATRLGDGDFSAPVVASSGIGEIDSISQAIRLSGNRVQRMLESERGFTADATHQLRTGLTGLAMRLELLERNDDPDVSVEADTLLGQIHDLNQTLDELLAVARKGSTGERTEIDLTQLVNQHVSDWQGRFAAKRRDIIVTIGQEERVIATPGLVGQILNVLFDNSLAHGRGTVAVLVHDGAVTIEDEGDGIDDDAAATLFQRNTDHQAAHGRGLALARRLAESDGGRLELQRARPAVFTLSLLRASVVSSL